MIIELLILTMGTTNIEYYNVNPMTVLDTIRLLEEHEDLLGYTKTIKFYGDEYNYNHGGFAYYGNDGCTQIYVDSINEENKIDRTEFRLVHELSHCIQHKEGLETNEDKANEQALEILNQ